MNKQDKIATKFATWFIAPDGYAFLGCVIDNNEDECRDRHKKMMEDSLWNGFKFIHVPISIPIPDDVVNKTIME